MAIFMSGGKHKAKKIKVSITGSADNMASYYVEFNGTRYTRATTIDANVGDSITFSVSLGSVVINGNTVATGLYNQATYNWTIPNVSNVSITFVDQGNGRHGFSVVTS